MKTGIVVETYDTQQMLEALQVRSVIVQFSKNTATTYVQYSSMFLRANRISDRAKDIVARLILIEQRIRIINVLLSRHQP